MGTRALNGVADRGGSRVFIAAVRCEFAARFGPVTKAEIVMSPAAAECAICGEPITGESPSGELKKRKPCPRCGSLARKFFVQAHFTAAGSVTMQAVVRRIGEDEI
jgi:hypothetical protein